MNAPTTGPAAAPDAGPRPAGRAGGVFAGLATARRSVGLTMLVVGLLLPFVPLLVWTSAATWRFPALLPQRTSARALDILTDPSSQVLTGLATSATIAVVVAVLAGLVGLSAGRALGLYTFRGKRLVQFVLLAPVIVPGLATTLGIQVYFLRYGLADTVPGVVLVQLVPTIPYVTLVMGSVYANYDPAYEEQARVLGASPLRVFLTVTLPSVRPGLVVAMLFAFLISWSEYILTLLIGGGLVKTLPLLLFSAISSGDSQVAATMGLALIAPPMVLVALAARFLGGSASGGAIGSVRL